MIEILDLFNDDIFGIRLNGDFTKQDVDSVLRELRLRAENRERISIYYEIENLDLRNLTREMLFDDIKFLFKYPEIIPKFQKAALVTDLGWVKKIFAVETSLIPTFTGKSFYLKQKPEALGWLENDGREDLRLDLTAPEFVQFGAVKGLGGLGLGLLAANYLRKSDRKTIGIIALGAGIALGLPLALKVLNNNRKLLTDKKTNVKQA
ncbi:MAG: STAS/SEC14 domain-containing protein [Pyrinomonadaceae bacterium]